MHNVLLRSRSCLNAAVLSEDLVHLLRGITKNAQLSDAHGHDAVTHDDTGSTFASTTKSQVLEIAEHGMKLPGPLSPP